MNYSIEDHFQAIDILIDEKMKQYTFDQTITCTVLEISQSDPTQYLVTNNQIKFWASNQSINDYYVNDLVYVLIPNGDYNLTKIIIGGKRKETEVKLDYSPLKNYIPVENFEPSSYTFSVAPTCDKIEHETAWQVVYNQPIENYTYEYDNNGILYDNPDAEGGGLDKFVPEKESPKIFTLNKVHLRALVKTDYPKATQGKYGIKMRVSGENDYRQVYYFQEFFGNPYNYLGEYNIFDILFDIDLSKNINKIEICAYQDGNFSAQELGGEGADTWQEPVQSGDNLTITHLDGVTYNASGSSLSSDGTLWKPITINIQEIDLGALVEDMPQEPTLVIKYLEDYNSFHDATITPYNKEIKEVIPIYWEKNRYIIDSLQNANIRWYKYTEETMALSDFVDDEGLYKNLDGDLWSPIFNNNESYEGFYTERSFEMPMPIGSNRYYYVYDWHSGDEKKEFVEYNENFIDYHFPPISKDTSPDFGDPFDLIKCKVVAGGRTYRRVVWFELQDPRSQLEDRVARLEQLVNSLEKKEEE